MDIYIVVNFYLAKYILFLAIRAYRYPALTETELFIFILKKGVAHTSRFIFVPAKKMCSSFIKTLY